MLRVISLPKNSRDCEASDLHLPFSPPSLDLSNCFDDAIESEWGFKIPQAPRDAPRTPRNSLVTMEIPSPPRNSLVDVQAPSPPRNSPMSVESDARSGESMWEGLWQSGTSKVLLVDDLMSDEPQNSECESHGLWQSESAEAYMVDELLSDTSPKNSPMDLPMFDVPEISDNVVFNSPAVPDNLASLKSGIWENLKLDLPQIPDNVVFDESQLLEKRMDDVSSSNGKLTLIRNCNLSGSGFSNENDEEQELMSACSLHLPVSKMTDIVWMKSYLDDLAAKQERHDEKHIDSLVDVILECASLLKHAKGEMLSRTIVAQCNDVLEKLKPFVGEKLLARGFVGMAGQQVFDLNTQGLEEVIWHLVNEM